MHGESWHYIQFLVPILVHVMGFSVVYVQHAKAECKHCNVCRMETVDVDGISYRYYLLDNKLDFDEDDRNEFKGHLNFTKDQIHPYSRDIKFDRPSKQPVSK